MTVKRDADVILAAWLDEGPDVLPESTRRAIAVSTRTTRQSRLPMGMPWRFSTMNGMTRYAVAAVAVVAVVVGGLFILRPSTTHPGGVGGPASPVPSASPSPSASPTPPESAAPSVGELTQAFISPTFGYSMKYPDAWRTTPTNGDGPTSGGADEFVSTESDGWYARALSRQIPDGVVVDDWIVETLQPSDDPGCMTPRATQESVIIDGREGRILGFCGTPAAPQIEATVVADKRAYLFSLFDTRQVPNEAEARALFDRFAATITLDPASAGASPSPNPSPS
jgi:hypothetical protein